jgi:hypothetical protein
MYDMTVQEVALDEKDFVTTPTKHVCIITTINIYIYTQPTYFTYS